MTDTPTRSALPNAGVSLLEILPTGVMVANAAGRYIEANAAASRILGFPRELLLDSGLPEPGSNLLAEDGSVMPPEETPGVIALWTGKAVHRKVLGLVRDNGDVLWLEVSAEPLPDGGVVVSFEDVTRHHLTESILAARTRIAEVATTASLEDILRATLDEVERLTGSCIGFYHFVEADQTSLILEAWSSRVEDEFCKTTGRGRRYPLAEAGAWAEAVRSRRPVIKNDFAEAPPPESRPTRPARVHRELVVPVLRGGQVLALLGVGNKPFPYGNRDLQTVLRLADLAWDIVERKRSEDALRESEVRYRTMFDDAPIGLWEEDFSEVVAAFKALQQDGIGDFRCYLDQHPEEIARFADLVRVIRINKASVMSLKAESEAAIVHNLPHYFTQGSLMAFKEALLTLLGGSTHHRLESPHLDALGDLLFFDISFTVQPGHEVSLSRVLVSFLDITNQKRAQDSLTASESRLKTLTRHSPDHILLLDLLGNILYINHVLPGYQVEKVIGQNWFNWMVPEAQAIARSAFAEVIESGQRVDYEVEGAGSPGETRWYSCRLSPVVEDGVLRSLVLFSTDISDRKRSDLALQHSEQQYRGLFDSMNEGFALHEILMDEKGQPNDYRFLDVNPAFVAITGLPRDRWIGRTVREVLPGIEPRWIGEYGQVALTGKPVTFEDESKDLGRWYRVTAYRTAPKQFAVLVTDITETRRIENERKQLDQQIARTQKMESLGSLAGGVAHDMNNVLGAIMGLASIHLEQAPEDSRLQKSMGTILKACTRGRALVKGLLGFARQELAEVRVLDLNELILEEMALLERTILASIRIETDLTTDLRLIHGDPASLSHVLMNLCVNAVDAMPTGGQLSFRTRNEDPETVLLEVTDTGCGMTPEVLEKALDPFFTTKGQGKGTGLGLSIVYGAVKAHHGRLEITSAPGTGTSVLLRFPAAASGFITEPSMPPRPPNGHPRHVLVVDDDELIQDSLAELLRSMGHHPSMAPSGEEALRQLEHGLEVDVVLLDLNMPGLGGAGTLPRLRLSYPDLPVLLATGRADQAAMDLVARTPKTLLLPKPFSSEEITGHFQRLGLS